MGRIASALGLIFALATLGGLVGTPHAQAPAKTDPGLDKLGREFVAAFNAKDAAKVADFYADDAVLMPPNSPLVRGRAAIQAHYKQQFDQGITDLRLSPIESAIRGNSAFEAGASSVQIRGGSSMLLTGVGGGGPVRDDGKYVVIFRRVGADWKIVYDIFNSDKPLPK